MFTQSDTKYLRTNLMRQSEYQVYAIGTYDIVTLAERDPLSPEVHDFINGLDEFIPAVYTGQQLTTMCQFYHGTVTTIWFVLMVNGLLSRTELRSGMELLFPTPDALRRALARNFNIYGPVGNGSSGRGQTVVI